MAKQYVPHHMPLIYDGKHVKLSSLEEETCNLWVDALARNSRIANTTMFKENFFSGLKKVLDRPELAHIMDFNKCDFSQISIGLQKQRSMALTGMEREAKDREKVKYGTARIDGLNHDVKNFQVPPPALFMGRGKHPKNGCIRRRIEPEDITINIMEHVASPIQPPTGREWAGVVHNQKSSYLVSWCDSVTGERQYINVAESSLAKSAADILKFDTARELGPKIESIRSGYRSMLAESSPVRQQMAIVSYLVLEYAIRAGHEKDESGADTVGVCTLRKEHLSFVHPSTIKFSFLGKDSIPYERAHVVESEIYDALQKICENLQTNDAIFDQIDPSTMNNYLQSIMPKLTMKVN